LPEYTIVNPQLEHKRDDLSNSLHKIKKNLCYTMLSYVIYEATFRIAQMIHGSENEMHP